MMIKGSLLCSVPIVKRFVRIIHLTAFILKEGEVVVSGQRSVKTVTFGFKLKFRISYEYGELIYEVETAALIKYTIGNWKDLQTVKIIRLC